MGANHIRLPADSTGKKVQSWNNTIGADDVHTQAQVVTDSLGQSMDVAGTATLSNVPDAASSTSLLASNTARIGVVVHNDSTSTLYLKYGATASATSYTFKIPPDGHWVMPGPVYRGAIDGIWDSNASGNARITELT